MGTNLVGIDIGECAVKLVQTSDGVIRKAARAEVLDNMVADGVITSMDAMADFLKETAKEAGISGGPAAIILPDRLVVTRNITLPIMTETQLKYNLPFEFRDYLEDEKNRYFYDYAVREMVKDEEGQPSEVRLLACAVRKDTISEYRQMLKRAGFKLSVAVPRIYAYERYVENADDFDDSPETDDYCLVNIGHMSTFICFYHDREIVSSKVIDIGFGSIDRKYAEAEEIDIHVAHSYVINNYENVLESQLALDVYNSIAVEVMKAVNFFNYNNRDASLSTLHMLGGGALIPQMLNTMADVTGYPIVSAGDGNKNAVKNIEDSELYIEALAATL